ncbi:MAG: hypothetical protein JNL70_03450 [Saprospiraceae bacterium]|nr:hypothetical protein [Saprospiraceae bacterium]
MIDLSRAFQQVDCPFGCLIFHQNTEGGWFCAEANTRAEQLLETPLVSKNWSDIFPDLAINTISTNTIFMVNEGKYVSLNTMSMSHTTYIVFLNDVSEQEIHTKQLEKKVEKLRSSNKDLEHFAYVASHDLREPLRKIVAFSERLNKKYASVLEGDGLIYLSRMIDATQRMQMFIDDLLMFSRFSRDVSEKIPIDLNEILRGVLSDFDLKIETTKAEIQFDNLPVINGVKSQMVQLFQNLISNALKFKKNDVLPRISIQCHELKKEYKLTIKDNGIGFEEADNERIFVIFQRLNGRSEYEGTGIGLAICKKIVENHGGSISAEGTPDKGAKFTILLPKSI